MHRYYNSFFLSSQSRRKYPLKKHIIPILVAFLTVLVAFMAGLYWGRHLSQPAIQLTSSISDGPTVVTTLPKEPKEEIQVSFPIDINSANLQEIMALPDIGEVLAQRIIDYRSEYGPFETPESIMEVYGISDKRYEKIKDLICIGGK